MKILATSVHDEQCEYCDTPLGQKDSRFWYHVHQLLEEVPRRLPEGGDDLVQVVVADPLLEHLLRAGKVQAHRHSFGFCIRRASTMEIKCLFIIFHFSRNFKLLFSFSDLFEVAF